MQNGELSQNDRTALPNHIFSPNPPSFCSYSILILVNSYKLHFSFSHFFSFQGKENLYFFFILPTEHTWWKTKGMFGNCFFSLFSVFKNNFLFLRLKNLFGNSKWVENKNCFQNSICEGNWKYAKGCFQFLIFKSQWKHAFNLMNLSYLMS